MKSLKDLWCLVQEEMKRNISEVIYEVWLSDIVLESFEGTKAVLAIGEFKRKIIEQKFYQVICDAFENVLGFSVNVELVEPLKEGESRDGEKKGDGATSDSNEKNTFDTFVNSTMANGWNNIGRTPLLRDLGILTRKEIRPF